MTPASHPDDHPCAPHRSPVLDRRHLLSLTAVAAALVTTVGGAPGARAAARPQILDRLVPGFLEIDRDPWGWAVGPNGFSGRLNPWGAYTAHLFSADPAGHRTWRIDNYLPNAPLPRPEGASTAQDSTCWLIEGSDRALLVDTGQDTPETIGVNDLTTVVRHLLGHDDDGRPRADPVDFDVAITHLHPDHTGKLAQMTGRTVYYPDLDWPAAPVPDTWVPVRQDAGSTPHGTGRTVNRIGLGDRLIAIVDLPGHTPGSTGYLDTRNRFLVSGDALGSAFVYTQSPSGTTSTYLAMLAGLIRALAPLRGIRLLPAHYDQLRFFGRDRPPLNGRIGDLDYIADLATAARGALDGSIAAEPFYPAGRETVWTGHRSARLVHALTNLYPGGPAGGNGDRRTFHQLAIPARYPTDPYIDGPFAYLRNIRTDLVMIREWGTPSLYLMRGSRRALLIGTGTGTADLPSFVRGLLPSRAADFDVLITSDDADQTGGLRRLRNHRILAPRTSQTDLRPFRQVTRLRNGDRIDLGKDAAGRAVALEVHALTGHAREGITVLDPVSRVLYSGDALGTQGPDGLVLRTSTADFLAALRIWRKATDGRYDTIYTAHNHQWFTRPAYLDSLETAAAAGQDRTAYRPSPLPGHRALTAGTADVVAWIHVPERLA